VSGRRTPSASNGFDRGDGAAIVEFDVKRSRQVDFDFSDAGDPRMECECVADPLLQPLMVVDHRERADEARVTEHFRFDVGPNPGRQRSDVQVVGRDLKLRMAGDRGQVMLPGEVAAVADGEHNRQAAPDFGTPEDAHCGASGGRCFRCGFRGFAC
jgi:hypothetical protein